MEGYPREHSSISQIFSRADEECFGGDLIDVVALLQFSLEALSECPTQNEHNGNTVDVEDSRHKRRECVCTKSTYGKPKNGLWWREKIQEIQQAS